MQMQSSKSPTQNLPKPDPTSTRASAFLPRIDAYAATIDRKSSASGYRTPLQDRQSGQKSRKDLYQEEPGCWLYQDIVDQIPLHRAKPASFLRTPEAIRRCSGHHRAALVRIGSSRLGQEMEISKALVGRIAGSSEAREQKRYLLETSAHCEGLAGWQHRQLRMGCRLAKICEETEPI